MAHHVYIGPTNGIHPVVEAFQLANVMLLFYINLMELRCILSLQAVINLNLTIFTIRVTKKHIRIPVYFFSIGVSLLVNYCDIHQLLTVS